MAREHVLVVDDDTFICRFLQRALTHEGYVVATASTGQEALATIAGHNPVVVLLDVMLPDIDGAALCGRLRVVTNAVIIMLTAKTDVGTRVESLDLGADDYVTKPFQLPELLARMRAQLRRHRSNGATLLTFADVAVDPLGRVARRGQRELHLTLKEFDMLLLFMRQPGRVVGRAAILDEVWADENMDGSNAVDVHLHHLRAKLHGEHERPLLHTIRRVGYVLREEAGFE
jgi:DNA-binding response OmpR family regulator